MKKYTKIILLIVIVLFIAGMAFYPTIQKSFSSKEKEPRETTNSPKKGGNAKMEGARGKALNVNVKILQPETLLDVLPGMYGTLIPDEEVDLSFETSGKITQILFKEGTSVRKGDLLAKVNDKPLQAELQKLVAQMPLAEDRVFRQKSLLAKDAVSKEAFEQVSTDLEKLKADIELTKARIAQTELRAPFDGIIGLRSVSEGAFVNSSTYIAKLTKISPIKIEFSVNEAYVNKIHPGTLIRFTSEDKTHDASIYAIESKVDLKTRTMKARAIFPNSSGLLKPGSSAYDIQIRVNEIKNALTIPNESIIAEMGQDIVYLYKGGKAQRATLKKGLRTESNVQVLGGLEPGDTLITTGVMQLRDGMPVVIDNVAVTK